MTRNRSTDPTTTRIVAEVEAVTEAVVATVGAVNHNPNSTETPVNLVSQ
jgi:hypothetical protein